MEADQKTRTLRTADRRTCRPGTPLTHEKPEVLYRHAPEH